MWRPEPAWRSEKASRSRSSSDFSFFSFSSAIAQLLLGELFAAAKLVGGLGREQGEAAVVSLGMPPVLVLARATPGAFDLGQLPPPGELLPNPGFIPDG